MTKQQEILKARTDAELIKDWETLDSLTKTKATLQQATVRGWLMDEIELRFPEEFDNWIDNCDNDDNIRNYIKVA